MNKSLKIISLTIVAIFIAGLGILFSDKEVLPNAVMETPERDFIAGESIQIKIYLGEKLVKRDLFIKKARADEGFNIENELTFNSAEIVNTRIDIEQVNDEELLLTIYPPQNKFKPGKYTITTTIITDDGSRQLSQDFNWGVLALNTNKSIYSPFEKANIYYGVLNENGSTICNASLQLSIIMPNGSRDILSSENGLIQNGPECRGNNVTIHPDYLSEYQLSGSGRYLLELEATTFNGKYRIFDYFDVSEDIPFDIERVGPTRINPTAAYKIEIKVTPRNDFEGSIVEVVPSNFKLTDFSEGYRTGDPDGAPRRTIIWDVKLNKGEEAIFSYTFDAIDVSPMFYLLGPVEVYDINGDVIFRESRYWQIASDETGQVILFLGPGDAVPSDWTCISCGGGVFENRFPVGSSSAGFNGGSNTHTHSVTTAEQVTTSERRSAGGTGFSTTAHDHPNPSTTVTTESNRPLFATLQMIKSDGVPSVVPQGAIAMFDGAIPSGWTASTSLDNRMILASGSAGGPVFGGSDTVSHTVDPGDLTAASEELDEAGGGGDGAATNHTHTVGSLTSSIESLVPSHSSVFLAECTTGGGCNFNGVIAMFDDDPTPSVWTEMSNDGEAFENAFIEASASYQTVTQNGASKEHAHDNTSITSGGSSGGGNVGSGTGIANTGHTHVVDITGFNTLDHRPPFRTVIIAKKIAAIKISGNAYEAEATTAWIPCDGSTLNISLVINGGTVATTSCNDGTGAYEFPDKVVAANDPISVFFNASNNGAAITVANDDVTDIVLNPRKNRVWVKSETGVSNITNSDINHCDSVSPAQCSTIPFDVTSSNLTLESGVELHIETGKTFAPGGNVSVPNLHIKGTYTGVTGGTETLILTGSGTGACTTDPGTIRPLCIDSGTFTASEETRFDGSSTSNIEATTYEDLHVSGSATFQGLSGTITVNDEFEINAGSTIDVSVNNNVLNVSAIASISGTFTSGTGTKTFSGNFTLRNGGTYTGAGSSATTAFRGATVNLDATSTWTKGSEVVTFDRGGGLTTTWTDSNSTKQDMGAVTISANGGNTTLDLGSSTEVTSLTIDSSQTLDLNGSNTLTLLGNSTPFTVTGTFTPATGTIDYSSSGTSGTTITSTTYNNLTLNKASNTFTAGGNITLTGSSTPFTITAGTFAGSSHTFTYNSTSNTNITQATYNNLTLDPSGGGGPTYTLGTTTSQTITVSGNYSMGTNNTVTVNATTHDPTFDIDGNFSIESNGTFTASNTDTFSIAGNWTMNGTFNDSSGTIIFDTTGTTILAGATTFNNFTVTTDNKTLQFTAGQTFVINGLLTLTGSSGNEIHIHSTSGVSQWFIDHQGTESITSIHLEDSGCGGGSTNITLDSGSIDGDGNNGSCWVFPPNQTKIKLKGSNIRLRGGLRL